MSINRVVISGNLTRDPELRSTAGGMAVLQLGLAVNDRVKENGEWTDRPNFFDVVVFGTRGERLSTLLAKGAKVAVEGKLRWRSWEDKSSGDKRSKVEIIADDIEFMSAKGGDLKARAEAATGGTARYADEDDPDLPF